MYMTRKQITAFTAEIKKKVDVEREIANCAGISQESVYERTGAVRGIEFSVRKVSEAIKKVDPNFDRIGFMISCGFF